MVGATEKTTQWRRGAKFFFLFPDRWVLPQMVKVIRGAPSTLLPS
jgi:hypothetical protein